MTLKETTKILTTFFDSHALVNSVTQYDIKRFINDRAKEYLVANIYFLDSAISGKVRTDSFQITLADLLTPTSSNEFEIYNNCLEIAEDFFTFLQYHPEFTFNKSANSQKFSEEDGDLISGITFKISIQTIRPQSSCSTPIK